MLMMNYLSSCFGKFKETLQHQGVGVNLDVNGRAVRLAHFNTIIGLLGRGADDVGGVSWYPFNVPLVSYSRGLLIKARARV